MAENEFRTASPKPSSPVRSPRPADPAAAPVWEARQEIEMYWHAWRIAVGNIRQPQEGSGFVSPYLDIAYNGNIFAMGRLVHDVCPLWLPLLPFSVRWTTSMRSSIPTASSAKSGPTVPTVSSVTIRLRPARTCRGSSCCTTASSAASTACKGLPALCAYAKWWRLNRTWPDGTYWSSGWGTGMDNMPRVSPNTTRLSHGHMVWLDTNLQQMLVDESLLNIGFISSGGRSRIWRTR